MSNPLKWLVAEEGFEPRYTDSNSIDPAELLPDAFARLEQIAEDRALSAALTIKAQLRKALR